MSNIPVPTSPTPVAKAPGSSKRVITTQATPAVQRPPQLNPNNILETSGQDCMGNPNANFNHNPSTGVIP